MATERSEGFGGGETLGERQQLAGALVRLEAWARIHGLEEEALLLEPALERLDELLTAA